MHAASSDYYSKTNLVKSHHWERWWKNKEPTEEFEKAVINPLVDGDVNNPSFLGFPQLPQNCFTAEKNLKVFLSTPCIRQHYLLWANTIIKATVFAPTFLAGTSAKYKDRLALLVSAVAKSMSLSESDIKVQLYDARLEDNYNDEEQEDPNVDTANGKILLTYNNDIFRDGNTAAYQVWAGAQVIDGVKQANSALNSAMMEDTWRPTFSRKRAILRYLGWA